VALSTLFGTLHYFTKPMETWADGLSTGLLGLFLCYTVRLTGDIWLAAGFHFGWNFLAMAVFGGPNTGNDGKPLTGHLLASSFHGPPWLVDDPDHSDMEYRFLTFGVSADGRLLVVAHTEDQ
jgi:membrane protease YdiL (CAAX protease family)